LHINDWTATSDELVRRGAFRHGNGSHICRSTVLGRSFNGRLFPTECGPSPLNDQRGEAGGKRSQFEGPVSQEWRSTVTEADIDMLFS
jgi:hypothetical protein